MLRASHPSCGTTSFACSRVEGIACWQALSACSKAVVAACQAPNQRYQVSRTEKLQPSKPIPFSSLLRPWFPRRSFMMATGQSAVHTSDAPISAATLESPTTEDLHQGSYALASYLFYGRTHVGLVAGDNLWPLSDCVDVDLPIDMLGVIKKWPALQGSVKVPSEGGRPLSLVQLFAPLAPPPRPPMCVGKNYREHVKEVDTWKGPGITQPDIPKVPIIFTKAAESVIGPGASIHYPAGISSQVDYEGELAVIIGKGGRCIAKESAMEHVFGYTCLNDVTARDLQKQHQQWFLGKSVDTFCPLGPWIVPASLLNGQDLGIRTWVNGELRQESRTSEMIFGIADLIATISAAVSLQPGDVIATGTPAGVGAGFSPQRWLLPGDIVEVWVEGIGKLSNVVSGDENASPMQRTESTA